MGIKITPSWTKQFPALKNEPGLERLFSLKKKDWVWVKNGQLQKIDSLWNKICYLFCYFSEKAKVHKEIKRLVSLLKPENLEQHQRVIKLVRKKLAHIDPALAKGITLPKYEGLNHDLVTLLRKGETVSPEIIQIFIQSDFCQSLEADALQYLFLLQSTQLIKETAHEHCHVRYAEIR